MAGMGPLEVQTVEYDKGMNGLPDFRVVARYEHHEVGELEVVNGIVVALDVHPCWRRQGIATRMAIQALRSCDKIKFALTNVDGIEMQVTEEGNAFVQTLLRRGLISQDKNVLSSRTSTEGSVDGCLLVERVGEAFVKADNCVK